MGIAAREQAASAVVRFEEQRRIDYEVAHNVHGILAIALGGGEHVGGGQDALEAVAFR